MVKYIYSFILTKISLSNTKRGINMLENKLGIESSSDLAREEERISKKKAAELFEKGILDDLPVGTTAALRAIHKYLF